MFRARCYWARFHPKYSITPDSLHVEKLTNGFQLILSLHLSCRNVDDLQVLLLDCTGMRIELRGKMKGRKPLLPLTYNTGVPIWRIQPNTELTLSPYTLTYWIQSRPKLGQLASCRHIVMGTATLIATNRMSISRPLKMRGFDIHVNWEDRTNAKT